MIRVRLHRHDRGTPRAVGFLDFFDKGEAPTPYLEGAPGLIAPAKLHRIWNEVAHGKVVGTIAWYDWRFTYA